ncbi:hypothetical protein DTR89_23675 [Salmonella enterica]|nr:hypothetical protein [Salmonella enterica]EBI2559831.1 hypothetical protein [Salmonella enterica]EBJ6578830.1 hypothetical protein [Salmonella enterica]EBJ7359451.1 hypothetical protein [Salmonella enterica]EBK9684349.1 hypothetical protein [Salmonella enterica]
MGYAFCFLNAPALAFYVGFSTKQKRAPAVTAFRVDWVMSPSRGDALFCFVKRSASRQNTVAFLLLLEEPDADKTSHSNSLSACF